ncbi:MAG: glycosyltransferase family 2 protein [Ferruginibacter sp.]|nr:glycosyltransferase family 2 protein [Ferruginibacter sp.]
MDVSIILVNYKSCQLVLNCIESIYRQTVQHSFEIILVDNDSNDDCEKIVLAKYPKVRFLSLDYNAGFARANNAGIEISSGEYILLLNPDTIVLDGAIDKSIRLLKQHPEAVGCGVQLLNSDGSNQISGAYFIKGRLNILLLLPYLGKLIRYFGYRFNSTVPSVQNISGTAEVDWIVGAYMMVRRSVLKKSGLLDNDFFMYAEEIEWCGRLRRFGKLLLFAEPKVLHLWGGSGTEHFGNMENGNSNSLWSKKGTQILVSYILSVRKQYGIGWFLLMVGIHIFEIPVFFFCLFFEKIMNVGKATYKWKNISDYCKTIAILLQYFLKMLSNKPYFYKVK